jgi:hypothetical protein
VPRRCDGGPGRGAAQVAVPPGDSVGKRTMAGALQAFTTKYSTDQVMLNAGAAPRRGGVS